MNKVVKISLLELRVQTKAVRDRVLAGEKFLCLYRNKAKAELVKIRLNSRSKLYSNCERMSTYMFRANLAECWRAIDENPDHPGFIICHYGQPWGLFRGYRKK